MTKSFACAKCSALLPGVKSATRAIKCIECGKTAKPVEVTVTELEDGRRAIARMIGDDECQVCETTEGVVDGLCPKCKAGIEQMETQMKELAAAGFQTKTECAHCHKPGDVSFEGFCSDCYTAANTNTQEEIAMTETITVAAEIANTTEEATAMTFTSDEILAINTAAEKAMARCKEGTKAHTQYRMILNLSGALHDALTNTNTVAAGISMEKAAEMETRIAELEKHGFTLNEEVKDLKARLEKARRFYHAVEEVATKGMMDRIMQKAGLATFAPAANQNTAAKVESKPQANRCSTHSNITLKDGKCIKCEALAAQAAKRTQQASATEQPATDTSNAKIRAGISMIAKGDADITKASDAGLVAAYNLIMHTEVQDAHMAKALPVISAELKRREAAAKNTKRAANF